MNAKEYENMGAEKNKNAPLEMFFNPIVPAKKVRAHELSHC